MTPGASQPLQFVLSDEEVTGRIAVDWDAYVRFSDGIDTALAALLDKWHEQHPVRYSGRNLKITRPSGLK